MRNDFGNEMYEWCKYLFPINRSLTGKGVRSTLRFIQQLIPDLRIVEVESGTKAFDWVVPNEWNINKAWIKNSKGECLVDFDDHNLHVMGYSIPINRQVTAEELNSHLFSLPESPDAIPYVTSYYTPNWGFCIRENDRKLFSEGAFDVQIDSVLAPGHMSIGELYIQGESTEEILLTTYVCHPSMANNELSGPAVLTKISQTLLGKERNRYSYRILFLVETIGSLYYLSKHLPDLKKNVVAGYVLTCIGDDRTYSYIPTRAGNTLSDRVARHVMKKFGASAIEYSWMQRGSDERQFNAPGVDIPIASIMRSKYEEYPEYHTSNDDLSVISPSGLSGGYEMVLRALTILESNYFYKIRVLGEPQLGRRGLYPNTSIKSHFTEVRNQMNVISFLDGKKDLLEISELCGIEFETSLKIIRSLEDVELLDRSSVPF
jgi:aminopeptidase-like protein